MSNLKIGLWAVVFLHFVRIIVWKYMFSRTWNRSFVASFSDLDNTIPARSVNDLLRASGGSVLLQTLVLDFFCNIQLHGGIKCAVPKSMPWVL